MHAFPRILALDFLGLVVALPVGGLAGAAGSTVRLGAPPIPYPDGRPSARYHLAAEDQGPVLHHGGGPGGCDDLGACDIWVWERDGTYYLH